MSQKPLTMEQLKQVLQLKKDGVPIREIARRTGVSRNAIKRYLSRLEPDAADGKEPLTNKQLAEKAYDNDTLLSAAGRLADLLRHFEYAEKELHRTGVNRQILWVEYIDQYPDGYTYSRYCFHLRKFLKHTDVSMHLEYEPGDMIMIDFAGKKLRYTHPDTGEVISVEVFVAILPFSGLIFCKAVPTQRTADFITCINSMLKFYGAVPKTILCDNLKTAVIKPCKYEPVFTEVCNQLSEHYQTTFSATRPYSPRDKAMVERAVNIVYSHIYAPLRNHIFFSLEELQVAMQAPLIQLNDKSYKNTAYSRQYFYEQYERTLLKTLSQENFTQKKVSIHTVQRNYHIQLSENRLYYSVPFIYIGKKVKVLYDNHTVEVYYDHVRIALHVRRSTAISYITHPEHMPPKHQHTRKVNGWTKEDLLSQAEKIGCYTLQVATHILDNSIYQEQNYKACYGMLQLDKKYSNRLEGACKRVANNIRINYTMIKNILKNGLDKQVILFDNTPIPTHGNIRGAGKYQ